MLFDSRLLLSIERQENEDAKSIIKSKELLHMAVDATENTLLHYSAEYGNREIAQFLTEAGSEVNAKNNIGQTPLMRVIESDSPCIEVIKFLLEAGAYLDEEGAAGKRVQDTINSSEWLNKDAGRFEILKAIIERAALCIDSMYYVSMLMHGSKEDIESLLQTNVELSAADSYGINVLHLLASNPNPGITESLDGRNFDINMRDPVDKTTPLHFAVCTPVPSSVEFFLKKGADIRGILGDEEPPTLFDILQHALQCGLWDTEDKDVKDIVQILLEHGVKPYSDSSCSDDDNEESTFFWFCWDNDYDGMAEIVLAHMSLQEALGTAINDVDRRRINRHEEYKSYFKRCQERLRNEEICPTVTMFDALTASARKLERLFRNEELASKLADFETSIGYYNWILRRRFEKASRMVKLRKTVTGVVSELMKMDYGRYPDVVDEVISYLTEEDIDRVASIPKLPSTEKNN